MIKKLFFTLFFILISFFNFGLNNVLAEEAKTEKEELTIYFFDDRLCPVCSDAKKFIENEVNKRPELNLEVYPISNTKKLKEIADRFEIEDYYLMAPTIFIGESFLQFTNFSSRQEEIVISAIEGKKVEDDCCVTRVPLLNFEVDMSNWSLGFAAMGLGIVDGFNVCSIGALILILTIVLSLNSRRKMLLFGGLFILTTVLVYGLLVFVWSFILELLIGEQEILRFIIGLAAFGGSIFFFRQFWRFYKYGPTCSSSNSKLARGAIEKLKKSFENPKKGNLYLALSVISFAGIITIVELPCSVGIPLTFSGILAGSNLSLLQYIWYIVVFLFFYMLVEFIIFFGAVLTKNIWFAGSKTITWITFIGALVLLYLALYYLPIPFIS